MLDTNDIYLAKPIEFKMITSVNGPTKKEDEYWNKPIKVKFLKKI